jgi:DNA (cytosine-5)-methyltransferase 1
VITIREAAQLQSFSDDFVFEGTYIQKSHQVGNAVPPLLMKAFGEQMRKLLGNTRKQLNKLNGVKAR